MKNNRIQYWILLILMCSLVACQSEGIDQIKKPNIIYILADDLGYGDISCLNINSQINTPNIDLLANQGLLFTDAHSSSSVCTPTRYGILTGRYAWRTWMKSGVLWSYDQALISPERTTIASLLSENDYHTACIGKWHLGLGWPQDSTGMLDFSEPIMAGPNQLGFDYFYGITASLDIPPYFYIENNKITASRIDTIEAMQGKKFWRKGPIGEDFKHAEVLPKLTAKALQYIEEQSKTENPFFLYFPLTAPHTPILPTAAFQNKSGTNEYGDFVIMVDDVLRQINQVLEETGIAENTLLIFTSDNGCSPMADFDELAVLGHFPSAMFRGAKADIYEGGHRVPMIMKWPAQIAEGSLSDEIICSTDLLATCADIIGVQLKDHEGEDSYSILPLIQGNTSGVPIREATVHHSIDGCLSIRKGKWKLEFCGGSGGWSFPTEQVADRIALPAIQLYDLENDIAEENNLVTVYPQLVMELTSLMQKYIDEGRSTPGTPQNNEGKTILLPKLSINFKE